MAPQSLRIAASSPVGAEAGDLLDYCSAVCMLVAAAAVMLAGDVRIERCKHPVRVLPVDPDVPVVMRLEHVGLIISARTA
jgi:hypothetical protein